MGRVTRTLRLLLAAAGLAHLAFSPPGRVRPAGGRRGKRLKQEPQSWSEVLTQMAPEESERGRSLPVAVAVRSWLRRIVIGDGGRHALNAVGRGPGSFHPELLVENDHFRFPTRPLPLGRGRRGLGRAGGSVPGRERRAGRGGSAAAARRPPGAREAAGRAPGHDAVFGAQVPRAAADAALPQGV
ncbi:unnamed protein product [Effrenium voratum]|nr:unnamed protein product [Effrenium voratum]